MRKRFYRHEHIEHRAAERLGELASKLGRELAPPIPIELLGEQVLGLDLLWDDIDEMPGEVIFAGLRASEALVVLNERRRAVLEEKSGLHRFTVGHEFGHWDLFTDHAALNHPALFEGITEGAVKYRSSGENLVAVLKVLQEDDLGRELLRAFTARADDPDEARAVNRYSSALLMPKDMIVKDASAIDRTRWPDLYRLAERYDVTISALTVRLEQLDLLYVERASGRLYTSKAAAFGQQSLF